MSTQRQVVELCLVLACLLAGGTAGAQSKDAACLKCHSALTKEPVVHAAMQLGCTKCHSTLDASSVPHKNTGKLPKGIAAKGEALCYECHEKEPFAKKTRHGALAGGCTGCHDAHASKHEKLLTEDPATLCFTCHERKDFEAKVKHAPVAEGTCTACHEAHASDHASLLAKPHAEVCLTCHAKVKKTPHATAGFSRAGHPIGGEKANLQDPARPGQPFYCGSCHEPHKSDQPRLSRFDQR